MEETTQGQNTEQGHKKKPSKPVFIAIAVAAAALIGLGIFSMTNKPAEPKREQTVAAQSKDTKDTKDAKKDTYTVPYVVSLTQADAEKAILASGLQVGEVTKQESDTVPLGNVISQDPKGSSDAKANSKVNLVISTGKAQPKDVTVPNLKGMTQDEAKEALKKEGLVAGDIASEETDEVKPGLVFKQSEKAGATVKEGAKVTFTVALAPTESTVPAVAGMTKDEAKDALAKANLGFDSTTTYSDQVDKDRVVSQSIKAGSKVKAGTTISLSISLGAKPAQKVTVPDVINYSWSEAEATMRSAGLAVRYTGDPAGKVVSQDVAASSQVDQNTLVTLTLASAVKTVEVPNIIGLTVESAEEATGAARLALDPTSLNGTVIDQWPAAGTQVEERTTVHATIDDSDFRNDGEEYVGVWSDERVNMQIEKSGKSFKVSINWGSSATENTSWTYTCTYKDGQLVSDSKGTKIEMVLDEDNQESKTVYTDGQATFSLKDGKLTWTDKKEGAGNGLAFAKE